MSKIIFEKLPLTISQQIALLTSRGLGFGSLEKAEQILSFVGYYRLSGYAKFYTLKSPNEPDTFKEGTTFEQILSLYHFDRKLRLLVLGIIERVEVAIKAVLSNTLSLEYGAHWYLEQRHFNAHFQFKEFLERLKVETGFQNKPNGWNRKQDPIFSHYYRKYHEPPMPPSWMLMEALSIGTISLIFERLARKEDKKKIAKVLATTPWILQSWLHSLTYVRNICAHHGRLYRRHFKITPVSIKKYHRHFENMNAFCTQAVIMHLLLQTVSPSSSLKKDLVQLFEEHPEVEPSSMGFSEKWEQDPFWKLNERRHIGVRKGWQDLG